MAGLDDALKTVYKLSGIEKPKGTMKKFAECLMRIDTAGNHIRLIDLCPKYWFDRPPFIYNDEALRSVAVEKEVAEKIRKEISEKNNKKQESSSSYEEDSSDDSSGSSDDSSSSSSD